MKPYLECGMYDITQLHSSRVTNFWFVWAKRTKNLNMFKSLQNIKHL